MRFLIIFIGGWILLRLLIAGMPVPPPAVAESSTNQSGLFAGAVPVAPRPIVPEHLSDGAKIALPPEGRARRDRIQTRPNFSSADPGSYPPSASDVSTLVIAPAPPLPPLTEFDRGGGGLAPPVAEERRRRWAVDGWAFLRPDSVNASDNLVAGGQLGGSQVGVRASYALEKEGRLRAYTRATIAVARPRQRELAVGVSHAPVAGIPVAVAVERRIALASEGRDAFAVVVAGGVNDMRLPARLRLESYGQGGIVGARRRDGFADGAVVVDRPVASVRKSSIRAGAIVAGAVQPGVSRFDVGPRLTIDLPTVGRGSRVALDWRFRVAGDARPGSGAALTIASHF